MPSHPVHALEKAVHGRVERCRCPKCGRNHKQKLLWIGRGCPRIFCQRCKMMMDDWGDTWQSDEFVQVYGLGHAALVLGRS
jgi:hypothetical protein